MSTPEPQSQPTASSRRDEALWMVTGLLLGLAVWLGTDNVGAGLGVGIALAFSFASQERASRESQSGRQEPARPEAS